MLSRLRLLSIFIYIGFLLIIVRLFYWQVIQASFLSSKVRLQHESGYVLSAPRGDILTSDGSYLVASLDSWLVYASLDQIKDDPRKISQKLAPLTIEKVNDKEELINEEGRIESLLSKKGTVWIPIKHRVANEVKKNIESLNLEGIGFEPEETRFYPEASSAAHLLGFVGKDTIGDDQGYFGLEGYYDLALSGKPGFLEREEDVKGSPISIGGSKEISAIGGIDLVTRIDKTIQLIVDQKLREGIGRYGATAGSVIVMDPANGGILAMSSFPTYEPSRYWDYGNEYFLNPVISSSFEPGSVFKIAVMASALDAGVVKPETICDMCNGPLKIDKYFIETWNNKYHPDSSMTDVIVNSDNVGMAFVAQKLGKDKLFQYLKKFGIGETTGIDLQGESTPPLRDRENWSDVDLVTAGFGQGVAVTPIQMIRVAAIIANKGMNVKPYVVDKIISGAKEKGVDIGREERVISQSAASKTTAMMVEAAAKGESKWAYIKGFKIAGKTGTAQIPIQGHYDTENTIASFVGFAPYDNPKFVMLITLNKPKSSPWASETAAPLWYSIARELFLYLGIQSE